MKINNALSNFYLSMDGVLSAETIKWYRNRLKSLVEFFGEKETREITLNDLRAWRSMLASKKKRWENCKYRPSKEGGLSVESIHCHVRAAQRFWTWLCDEEILEKNVARRLEKPPLPTRRKKGISETDRDKILHQAFISGYRDYALVLFVADTACRRGGVSSLVLDNLELEKRRAIIREKGRGGGKERIVYMHPLTISALQAYLKHRPASSDDHVFLSEFKPHAPLQETGVYEIFKRLAKRAGVRKGWNPHNWRHGSIRGMLDRGMPLSAASELAGHASTAITGDIYGSYGENILQEMHDRYSWIQDGDKP